MEEGYIDRVGAMLDKLPIGGVFPITEKTVTAETRAEFIEVVKSYIDRRMGNQEGWAIEFNGSFDDPRRPSPVTKIRKINIKHEKQKYVGKNM